jgi:Rieske Fe-S protein
VNLSLGLDSDLAGLGVDQTKILPGHGFKGIIIYRSDVDQYHAFDMACTFEEDFSCTVEEDPSFKGVVKCPCCSSQFLLMQGGDPINGPASWPLVEYYASINGRFLVIRN